MRKSYPSANRNLCTNYPMSTIKILFTAEHMHGAALARGAALRLPEQLAEHALDRVAPRELLAVIAVRRDQAVVEGRRRLHGSTVADRRVGAGGSE